MSDHKALAEKCLQWADSSSNTDGANRFVAMAQVHATLYVGEQVQDMTEKVSSRALQNVVDNLDALIQNSIAMSNRRG